MSDFQAFGKIEPRSSARVSSVDTVTGIFFLSFFLSSALLHNVGRGLCVTCRFLDVFFIRVRTRSVSKKSCSRDARSAVIPPRLMERD